MINSQYYLQEEQEATDPQTRLGRFISHPLYVVNDTYNDLPLVHVYHGPFSELFIKSVKVEEGTKLSPKSNLIDNPDADVSLTQWADGVEPWGDDEIEEALLKEIGRIKDEGSRHSILEFYRQTKLLKQEVLYGYQPVLLGDFKVNQSVDTLNFFTLFIAKFQNERINHGSNPPYIVLHPDTLYFLSNGDMLSMSKVAVLLSHLASGLNIKLAIENVKFNRKVFRAVYHWAEDPESMLSLLPDNSENIGLCIDISHTIDNALKDGVDPKKEVSRMTVLASELQKRNIPVVVHTRDTLTLENPLVKEFLVKCYTLAIPVAYEK
jgi:hypothetical protein